MPAPRFDALTATLAAIDRSDAAPAAAALFDYETGDSWAFQGDRWFHAASTIKVAVLAALAAALEARGLDAAAHLPVRNRFVSAADGSPYQVTAAREADAGAHRAIGGTLAIRDLARDMIAVSSNLATNVLLEHIGLDHARRWLAGAGLDGIDLVRGVEDDRAFEAGIVNRVTANGLVGLLRAIHEGRVASRAGTREMIDVLAAQVFRHGIPAGLPAAVRQAARVAHKTGEISTATHDAGIVFLPDRAPYILAVLTGAGGPSPGRYAAIARVSAQVYEVMRAGPTRPGG